MSEVLAGYPLDIPTRAAETAWASAGDLDVLSREVQVEDGIDYGSKFPTILFRHGTKDILRIGKLRPRLPAEVLANLDEPASTPAKYHDVEVYGELGVQGGGLHLQRVTDSDGMIGVLRAHGRTSGTGITDFAGWEFERKSGAGMATMYVYDGKDKRMDIESVASGLRLKNVTALQEKPHTTTISAIQGSSYNDAQSIDARQGTGR